MVVRSLQVVLCITTRSLSKRERARKKLLYGRLQPYPPILGQWSISETFFYALNLRPFQNKLCGPFHACSHAVFSKRTSLFYCCCTTMNEIGFFASYHPVLLNGMGILKHIVTISHYPVLSKKSHSCKKLPRLLQQTSCRC